MTDKTKILNVSNMDFDSIKSNLVTYLSSQTDLKDLNFEGSAMQTIMDALIYITHFNAVNANMALNEAFLDSAKLRQSVVSHAKLLGYTPRSAYPSIAYVTIQVNNPINVTSETGSFIPMTMPAGTKFGTNINGETYTFVTDTTLTVNRNSDGKYIFENVKLVQGSIKNTTYIYDEDSAEKYVIPYENAVTSSLNVTIKTSSISTEKETFLLASNITGITNLSPIYFLQEGSDGFYEIYFGDGIIGKKLLNGNVIQLSYIVTDTTAANGASKFSLIDTIQSNSDVTITTLQKAVGGSEREDLESIKYNAPLSYVAQNRAVTPDDYKTIITNSFSNIEAITVWGGEDNDPPDYGKVYISIKPKDSEFLSDSDKQFIISQYLKPKNVVSITPSIVNPEYTYIYLDVFFKYNPNLTNSSKDALANNIRENIRVYNNNQLKRFDGVFRYSNFLSQIDDSDRAIVNSYSKVYMKKRFIPIVGVEQKYELSFSNPIYKTTGSQQTIFSTEFVYLNRLCRLRDKLDINGKRILQIISGTTANPTVLLDNAGEVDEENGIIILSAFAPSSYVGNYIEITVEPNSYDLAPKRNELLTIVVDDCVIDGEVDTMITGGTSAGVNYRTVTR